ncbi:MAG: pyruvate dehydrogenase complex E1 component subunit beta [Sandaracinaceae bacterium]|nr:MAG: pyruvate dehydrogenase complex E1 component subunit beta [Sandaracinaceae bacterium]HBQ18469.1 pyruvate dehydrogenase complex E1 component subunit beta [Myxococcales bacterium]
MREIRYREALREAMAEEMRRDEKVFLLGEEVGHYEGAYKVTQGLLDEFGDERVIDTPIAEAGFAGVAVGAAMAGLRPIVEFMTWNFSLVAFDQIVNNAAKMYQMSAGQFSVPVVFRGPNASARQVGSQHSHAVEAFYANVPGLHVVYPSTPRDAKGLLKTAIRSDNPVVFLEGETLYNAKGEVPDEGDDETIPFGKARVAREGKDCTIVVWGRPYPVAMKVAEELEADGVSCEVIDPRTLRPLDHETIVESVKKTNRCVIVHEHWPYGGPGAEIVDRIQREAFDYLDAPVLRAHNLDVPMPYALHLEQEVIVDEDRIRAAVRKVCYLD